MLRASKRLILLSPGAPFPSLNGSAFRTISMAKAASRKGWEILIVTESLESYLHIFKGEVIEKKYPLFIRLLSKLLRPLRVRIHTSLIPSGEYQFYEQYYDPSWKARGLFLALRFGVRIYQGEFPGCVYTANALKKFLGGYSYASLHNIEHQRIQEIYPETPHACVEWLKDIEIKSAIDADKVVVVSASDQSVLQNYGIPNSNLMIVPNGVDLDLYKMLIPIKVRNFLQLPAHAILLIFHGGYSYPPNLEAIHILAKQILTHLPEHYYLYAVGSHPLEKTPHPRIFFSGPVADVAPHIAGCDVAVVPLLKGGGTRLKILEYFAARIPVIATSKAVEGMSVTNEKELLICDDFGKYPALIQKLISNSSLIGSLTEAGFQYASHCDWEKGSIPWLDELNKIANKH